MNMRNFNNEEDNNEDEGSITYLNSIGSIR